VKRHTIHALIGPNGAGKTTCFNLLTHFLTPTAGQIHFNGRNITGSSPAAIARMGLARSFQISAIFPTLTVFENVRVALQKRDGDWLNFMQSPHRLRVYEDRAMELLDEVGLRNQHNVPAVDLSYGRKRALELVTTLALEPKMLLLDEPMAGMGHEDIDTIVEVISRIGANRTILMVEHNLSVVSRICSRITVLARGQVLAEGDYETVSNNPSVIEAYIGGPE
jgi:branched-chain amino acid transport system ATP-binding protein